jgi:hypothetical protein
VSGWVVETSSRRGKAKHQEAKAKDDRGLVWVCLVFLRQAGWRKPTLRAVHLHFVVRARNAIFFCAHLLSGVHSSKPSALLCSAKQENTPQNGAALLSTSHWEEAGVSRLAAALSFGRLEVGGAPFSASAELRPEPTHVLRCTTSHQRRERETRELLLAFESTNVLIRSSVCSHASSSFCGVSRGQRTHPPGRVVF